MTFRYIFTLLFVKAFKTRSNYFVSTSTYHLFGRNNCYFVHKNYLNTDMCPWTSIIKMFT